MIPAKTSRELCAEIDQFVHGGDGAKSTRDATTSHQTFGQSRHASSDDGLKVHRAVLVSRDAWHATQRGKENSEKLQNQRVDIA